jgi:hypothetical protein
MSILRTAHIEIVSIRSPDSFEEFESLLARHLYLKDRPGFEKKYLRVMKYYAIRNDVSRSISISVATLSREHELPGSTIHSWIKIGRLPFLLEVLVTNESARRKVDSQYPKEALLHRIDSTQAYTVFRELSNESTPNPKAISSIITEICQLTNKSVFFIDFKHHSMPGPKTLHSIFKTIQFERDVIERELNRLLSLNSHRKAYIAIIDKRLYIYSPKNKHPVHFHHLCDEIFYLNPRLRINLIQQVKERMGGIGIVKLSSLIGQLTGFEHIIKSPIDKINADLKHGKQYLSGKTVSFFIDVLGTPIDDLMNQVSKIGRGKQILRPIILKDPEFIILMARLFAIVASDGHLQHVHFRLQYSEHNANRRRVVKSLLSRLGDVVTTNRYDSEGRVVGFYATSVIGRLLAKLGMPVGDKVLQGTRIPEFILNGSLPVKQAYLEELIPEEGCVSIRKGKDRAYILIGRRIVLFEVAKQDLYGFECIITSSMVDFIRARAITETKKYGKKDLQEKCKVLRRGRIRSLINSDNKEVATFARKLWHIVSTNPPMLLQDEIHLIRSLGVSMHKIWCEVTLYKTGRVSVSWTARTQSQHDTARFALLAPCNDLKKRTLLQDWMGRHPHLIDDVLSELKSENLTNETSQYR